VLLLFVAIPGFRIPFLVMAALAAWAATAADRRRRAAEDEEKRSRARGDRAQAKKEAQAGGQVEPQDLLGVEHLEMEVGFDLLALVDDRRGGDLMERIHKMRRQYARTLGVIVPPIHIRDNLQLKQGEYVLMLQGAEVARGELMTHHLLAIDPGGVKRPVQGVATKEPAFGLPALWITEGQRTAAVAAGYTVVDATTVMATHVTEVVKNHAPEFLGRQELQGLIDQLVKTHPKVVDELIPALLPLGTVLKVLKGLLREGVGIRNLLGILEALADHAPDTKDPEQLTEFCRRRLGRQIVNANKDGEGTLRCVTLAPAVEDTLRKGLQAGPEGQSQLVIDPQVYQDFMRRLSQEVEKCAQGDGTLVLLCAASIRAPLRRITERALAAVPVLSNMEVPPETKVKRVGTVRAA